MASIFSKIAQGEIPCYKIAETANCFAFLDAFPIREGHVLVIPKTETDYIFDLPDSTYNDLLEFAKTIAIAIKKAYPCKKVGMAVIGLEVPHAHIHLVPMNEVGDLNFSQPKLKLDPETLQSCANSIVSFL